MKIIDNYWHKKYNGGEYFRVYTPAFFKYGKTACNLEINQIQIEGVIMLVDYLVVEFDKPIQTDDIDYLFRKLKQPLLNNDIFIRLKGFKHVDKFRNPLLNIHMEIWN